MPNSWRKTRTLIIVLVALAVLATSCWLLARPAVAAGDGLIEGLVKNGTREAGVPAGQSVVLHVVSDGDRVERRQTLTDAEGRYRFEGLETAPGLRYLPLVEYQGVPYFPRPLTLAEQPRQTADITVYEATTSDQWVAYERANLLVQNVGPNRLDVMEMGAIANVGDRTYVGPEAPPGSPRQTLRFALPPGASDLALQDGFGSGDIMALGDGFVLASPIMPGRHELAFSYSLPFSSDQLQLGKRMEYPTLAFNFYLPDVGIRVNSPQLEPRGQADLGGQKYLVYGAQNLPRGTAVSLQLSGLPSSSDAFAPRLTWPMLLGGCLTLLGGLTLAYRRRVATRLSGSASSAQGGVPLQTRRGSQDAVYDADRMRLLLSLALLDERYERGELPEEQYRREREQSKRRLLALSDPRAGD
jgi:hypothetical protein